MVELLSNLCWYFKTIKLLMDCYTEHAAKASKYKNPINDVGVTVVYGYDNPQGLVKKSGQEKLRKQCIECMNLTRYRNEY